MPIFTRLGLTLFFSSGVEQRLTELLSRQTLLVAVPSRSGRPPDWWMMSSDLPAEAPSSGASTPPDRFSAVCLLRLYFTLKKFICTPFPELMKSALVRVASVIYAVDHRFHGSITTLRLR